MLVRILTILLFTSSWLMAQSPTLHLEIGDPERKGREIPLVLDAVTDAATGELLTPRDLAGRLAGVDILFLGESHTSMGFHQVQLRVLQELQRSGKKVLIGLEMYPYTEQRHLDHWTEGLVTEEGFVSLSRWYKNWGYHWNYYRDIFLFARSHKIRMFAVNTPREVVSAVRKKGFQNLTAEEKAHMPPRIDTDNPEHLELFRSFFAQSEGMHSSMSDAQLNGMFAAQCTWDATMAYNAYQSYKQEDSGNTVMVVLIGSGHVAYGLGVQRQAEEWFDGVMASLIPIEILDDEEQKIDTVRASYADYIWGLPPERETLYPSLGVATVEDPETKRRRIMTVDEDSAGGRAGFKRGDILLSMDGTPLENREIMNRLMADKRWGDGVEIIVEREGSHVTLQVQFRRMAP